MNEGIIARIKEIMAAKGISQAELVRRTGIRASSISDWLSGKYTPKQDKIDLMAAALGVSPAWLMYGKNDSDNPQQIDPETMQLAEIIKKRPGLVRVARLGKNLSDDNLNQVVEYTEFLAAKSGGTKLSDVDDDI